MGPLGKEMEEVLKEEADIMCRTQELDLQIKDIEETTSKEKLRTALQKVIDDDGVVKPESIRSLRVAYGETQTACVRLPVEIAHNAIGDRGKIRIGLVNCRIREVNRPLKCYRCWHSGHIGKKCTSEVDRSKLCMMYGGSGHKFVECNKEAHCVLCATSKQAKPCKHVTGSARCAAFNEASRKRTRPR
ncbi:hypothetical protein KM043_013987 [Ampulex compressa]|nr:hypothetical protein KM043_013987 [Ampulex compressa]